jgi:hypothetical protein
MRVESGASENSKLHEIVSITSATFLLPSLTSLSLCFPLFQKNGYVVNLSSELTQLKLLSADFQVRQPTQSEHRNVAFTLTLLLSRIESVQSSAAVVSPGRLRPTSIGESVCAKLLWVSLT